MQRAGDYHRTLQFEDDKVYRHHRQDLAPAIKRTAQIRELQERRENHTKENNPSGRQYIGSVPVVVLHDWLQNHGYTADQFARKEGTIRQEFMKYFLSRDFSKLHTQHSTTRVGTGNRIVVPNYIGGGRGDNELRGTDDSDS